ncbi:MAG: hypothetical protein PHQ40_09135 [Anaerolineaceae bacterium]|nr:hypothetical protein [Anaerolineaceae bacterium]
MIRKLHSSLVILIIIPLLLGTVFIVARAQPVSIAPGISPEFSYQGQLKQNGNPYTGTCNFTFKLWDGVEAGSQLGADQAIPGVVVTGGVFTVQLNGAGQFGPQAFSGGQRWLETFVQCPGDASPTILGRQRLNAIPFAQYSLAADTLDGDHANAFVNRLGDTMDGVLSLPKVSYTTPRLHVTSVSSEAFFPTSNVDYVNGGGQGGAWEPAGSTGVMAASVQLPDGAIVTKFRVYFYDNSAKNLDVSLDSQEMLGGGYATLASVISSGASTSLYYLEDNTISTPVIDNENHGYLVWVYPSPSWDGILLRIKGASIYYTLNEAP